MVLKFNGKTIPGTTEAFVYHGAPVQMRRVTYWDVVGEAEIVGERNGRDVMVTHILHDELENLTDLKREFQNVIDLIGTHGDLLFTATAHGSPYVESLRFCTLDDVQKILWPGQEEVQPIKDLSNTLFDENGEADGGWCFRLALKFRQLSQ